MVLIRIETSSAMRFITCLTVVLVFWACIIQAEASNRDERIAESTNDVHPRARRAIDPDTTDGLDVLFIFDASSSVKKVEFKRGIRFAKHLVKVLRPVWKSKGTKAAAILYAREAGLFFKGETSVRTVLKKLNTILKFRNSDGRKVGGVPKRLKRFDIIGGITSTHEALELAGQVFYSIRKERKRHRVLFLMTDTKRVSSYTENIARKLKQDYNMEIYAIALDRFTNRKELHKIATLDINHVIVLNNNNKLLTSAKMVVKTTVVKDYSPCGESNYDTRGRMVGGNEVSRGTWPWQVGIYLLSHDADDALAGKMNLFCGGALIRPGWILTTAHCFGTYLQAASLIIRAGDNERLTESDFNDKLERSGEEFFIHENFNKKTFYNNVALIKLDKPFKLAPHVRLVCLPNKTEPDPATPGGVGIVAGWGMTKALTALKLLQLTKAQVSKLMFKVLLQSAYEIQPNERCNASTSYPFNPNVTFCAGDGKGGNDTCRGDSGGSFVRHVLRNGSRRWVSTGLVSWGEGCAQKGKYGFYTRVAHFVDWIERTIKNNG